MEVKEYDALMAMSPTAVAEESALLVEANQARITKLARQGCNVTDIDGVKVQAFLEFLAGPDIDRANLHFHRKFGEVLGKIEANFAKARLLQGRKGA